MPSRAKSKNQHGGTCFKYNPLQVIHQELDLKVAIVSCRQWYNLKVPAPKHQPHLGRTLAYPYGALVLGLPNFWGLGLKGPIPFTKFRASRANMYGTLTHQIFPFLVHVWSAQIHRKSEVWRTPDKPLRGLCRPNWELSRHKKNSTAQYCPDCDTDLSQVSWNRLDSTQTYQKALKKL
jgi:hypothetical protein